MLRWLSPGGSRRRTIATLRLQVGPGARKPIALKLTRAARRLLARKRSLPVTVKLSAKTLQLRLLPARR